MQLTDDDIREFTMIWQTEFGEALPAEKARGPASQLMNLFMHIAEGEHFLNSNHIHQ